MRAETPAPPASEPRLDPDRVAVLGAGRLGRAVASLLRKAEVVVYDRHAAALEALAAATAHPRLSTTVDIGEAVRGASLLYLAVPASSLEALCFDLGPHALPDQMVLLASRGVTEGFQLPHEHVRKQTCLRQIGVLGGPLHVRELSAGRRMNAVIASRFQQVIDRARHLSSDAPVHFQASPDIIGVQVAGAVGNVASIAAGMSEALELGDTARGVILARGLLEAREIGVALGAGAETFSGLAGVGELIPRAVRSMERHLDLGRALGQGQSLGNALTSVSGHVEGLRTAKESVALGLRRSLELPLVSAVHAVAHEGADPRALLEAVLSLPLELRSR